MCDGGADSGALWCMWLGLSVCLNSLEVRIGTIRTSGLLETRMSDGQSELQAGTKVSNAMLQFAKFEDWTIEVG